MVENHENCQNVMVLRFFTKLFFLYLFVANNSVNAERSVSLSSVNFG